MKHIELKLPAKLNFLIMLSGLVILLIPSCTIIRLERKVDDGSTSLTKSDSLAIKPFSISDFNITRTYATPDEIKFQVIDAEQMNELVKRQRYSWIVLGASWCGVSKMALTKFPQIIHSFNPDSIRLIIIIQDLNIPVMQKELFDAHFTFFPYLLSSAKYGTDEAHKQENFAKDLQWDLPLRYFNEGGVPMNIIVDNDKNVKCLFHGIRITTDSISKYTGLVRLN